MTGRELADVLREAGIENGDSLLVHSAFRSLQPFENTPSDLVETLLGLLGPSGNLMFPTFNYSRPLPVPYFDPSATPARTGAVANAGRVHPRALRSLHPTHSVTVLGPDADALTSSHLAGRAFGVDSPIDRLARCGGKVLLLGVGQNSNSTLHVAEEHAGIPKASGRDPLPQARIRLPSGEIISHQLDNSPSCSAAFEAAALPLRRAGIILDARAGNCLIQLMRASDVLTCIADFLRATPTAMLCTNPQCAACQATRVNLAK